jgi:[NiFe] hydrogenase assembly HybE family chaperone
MSAQLNPAPRLAAAFRAAAERMRGLAVVNPALQVEAVGFAMWEGRWLGVMVTPWSMNLMLLPGDAVAWQALAQGEKRRYRFPAGDYEFIGAVDPAIGEFQICSLSSPVHQFADHATAQRVAELAREALFDASHAKDPSAAGTATSSNAAAVPTGPLAQIEAGLVAPLSKRNLLHGRFRGSHRDDRG